MRDDLVAELTADQLSLLDRMTRVSPEELLLPLLVQLALILVAARVFSWFFRRLGQPAVAGEIAAGLALGPSLLGWLAPGAFRGLFRPEVAGLPPEASDLLLSRVLMVLAQLGLVLMLFLVGMEFDFGHLWGDARAALAISLAGIFLPFAMGAMLGWIMHPMATGGLAREIPAAGFTLFLGTALSITALPVLGRMMLEWGVTRTRLAVVTISAAAVNDAVGWILLAAVAALVNPRSASSPWATVGMMAATVVFATVLLLVGRPLLANLGRRMLAANNGELGNEGLTVVLVVLLLCTVATSLIGIFAIFGAFLLGAALSGEVGLREAISHRLGGFVGAFFLPIFFAYTGLRTNVGTLGTWEMAAWAVAVSLVAIVGKFGGCLLAARWAGRGWRESACIGVLMNTRGLMELVVANVGRDLGVITEPVYCMLVLMALVTTFMTTPILMWLMPGTELEGPIRAKGVRQEP